MLFDRQQMNATPKQHIFHDAFSNSDEKPLFDQLVISALGKKLDNISVSKTQVQILC